MRFSRTSRCAGFTLVELLVVIAIIALLVSILLPSLAKAREESKKIKCLSNLRDIAMASIGYGNDDPSGFFIPVLPTLRDGGYVSASRRGFGGKSGLHDFEDGSFPNHPSWYGGQYGMWSTKNGFGPARRPLNRFLYKNLRDPRSIFEVEALIDAEAIKEEGLDFAVFECPSDEGYNSATDGEIDVIFGYGGTGDNREYQLAIPLYDAMGNSYATDALLAGAGGDDLTAYGAYFRKYESIPNPSRVTAYLEGKGFYAAFWNDRATNDPNNYVTGNHGVQQQHNVAFADGHAVPILFEVSDDVSVQQNSVIHSGNFVLRGGTTLDMTYNLVPGDVLANIGHLLLGGPEWQNHTQPSPPVTSDSVTW